MEPLFDAKSREHQVIACLDLFHLPEVTDKRQSNPQWFDIFTDLCTYLTKD